MNVRHRFGLGLSVLLAFLVTILVRCSTAPPGTVPPGTSFVVYALDGDTFPTSSPDRRDFGFHGWPILKECSISHSKGVEVLDDAPDHLLREGRAELQASCTAVQLQLLDPAESDGLEVAPEQPLVA